MNKQEAQPRNYSQMYKDIDKFSNEVIEKNPYLENFEKKAIISLREIIVKTVYQMDCKSYSKLKIFDVIKLLFIPFRRVNFTRYAPIVIARTTDKQDEADVVESLGYPLSKIRLSKNKSFSYFFKTFNLVPKIISKTVKTLNLIKNIPYGKKVGNLILYSHLVKYYCTYYKTDFKNIKTILTANTCYNHFPAITAKAEDCGINVVKIAYFMTNVDNVGTTRINAKYCFALDKVHEEFYKQFDYNKDVIFLGNGGRLSNDFLAEYTQKERIPQKNKQIIYLKAHSILEELDEYYIGVLKNFVENNNNYELIIKTHPLNKRTYEEYLSENVRVEKVFGREYFDMAFNADFVFSIFSTLSFQTKLINPNCYVLNFCDNEFMKTYHYDEAYNSYSKYLEVINSEEMLKDVLLGEHQTTSCEYYIKEINPDFGHVAEKFKQLVEEL